MTAIIVALFLVILVIYFKSKLKKYKDIDRLPGPSILELLNGLYISNKGGAINYLHTLTEKYGPIVKVWIKPFTPTVMTTDLEFCEKILYSNYELFVPSFLVVKSYIRDGIGTQLSEKIWRSDKKIIVKGINKQYIEENLNVYNKRYYEFVDSLKVHIGKPVDLHPLISKLLLEIMCSILSDPKVNLTDEEIYKYHLCRQKYFKLILEQVNSLSMTGILHKFTKNYRLQKEYCKELISFGEDLLNRHLLIKPSERQNHNLIYAMIDSGMPYDRTVDNINTLIQGGHDTTSIPLPFAFFELAKQPEIQAKLLEDVVSVLGKDIAEPITYNDLQQMGYLNRFVNECIRVFHPLPFLDRALARDLTIQNITLPKGTIVTFPLPLIQKSEKYFKDPLKFDPDRFLQENVDATFQKAFFAFGHGPKVCVGKLIALTSIKVLISKMIRKYEIIPVVPAHQVQLTAEISYKSLNGLPVILKERKYNK